MESKQTEKSPFNAPFEIVRANGSNVRDTWAALRKRPGIVPVLLGNDESTERVLETLALNKHSTDSIREHSLRFDVDAWLEQRVREEPEHYAVDEAQRGAVDQIPAFLPAIDLRTGQAYAEIFFGLIAAEAPWVVPAHLKCGGWNECPDAVVHTAFFRRWLERYDAVVTTVSGDVIEFTVARPPATREAARQLALEQFVYCPDIVHQGVETLGNLAAALERSPHWYFWWD